MRLHLLCRHCWAYRTDLDAFFPTGYQQFNFLRVAEYGKTCSQVKHKIQLCYIRSVWNLWHFVSECLWAFLGYCLALYFVSEQRHSNSVQFFPTQYFFSLFWRKKAKYFSLMSVTFTLYWSQVPLDAWGCFYLVFIRNFTAPHWRGLFLWNDYVLGYKQLNKNSEEGK